MERRALDQDISTTYQDGSPECYRLGDSVVGVLAADQVASVLSKIKSSVSDAPSSIEQALYTSKNSSPALPLCTNLSSEQPQLPRHPNGDFR